MNSTVCGKSGSCVSQLFFEETYRTIAPYRKFNKDGAGIYYDGGTEEAWQLWQKAKESPEYVNRSTAELIQDLLEAMEPSKRHTDVAKRARDFLKLHADKVNNVVIGPWTDGKKE